MGRFKNESTSNPIVDWLLKQGYKYNNSGSDCWCGYRNTYSVSDGFYYVWVTFNFSEKKIYVYKEYNCGGCVGDDEIDIKDEWLDDLNTFIDGVDEALESWIGE